MGDDALKTYLNDHLGGAAAGLDLARHLADSSTAPGAREFFAGLSREIEADRDTLEAVLRRFGGHPSTLRSIGGWVAERISQLKLTIDDEGGGKLKYFQSLELLVLGIHGKYSLWKALEAAGPALAERAGVDFSELGRRAREQRDQVEAHRLDAARVAFAPHAGAPVSR